MLKELLGSAGDGQKILSNKDLFKFEFKKIEDSTYFFYVKFKNQNGWMTIRVSGEEITDATLDCNFARPLGAYNDEGLYKVAQYVLGEYRKSKLI